MAFCTLLDLGYNLNCEMDCLHFKVNGEDPPLLRISLLILNKIEFLSLLLGR